MDLGIHLADLAFWLLDFPEDGGASGRLFRRGEPYRGDGVEDYAERGLDLAAGAVARIACSWNLPAGREARSAEATDTLYASVEAPGGQAPAGRPEPCLAGVGA